jgi:hypothetical protein
MGDSFEVYPKRTSRIPVFPKLALVSYFVRVERWISFGRPELCEASDRGEAFVLSYQPRSCTRWRFHLHASFRRLRNRLAVRPW